MSKPRYTSLAELLAAADPPVRAFIQDRLHLAEKAVAEARMSLRAASNCPFTADELGELPPTALVKLARAITASAPRAGCQPSWAPKNGSGR